MAIFIEGDNDTYDAAVYGRPTDNTISYLRDSYERGLKQIGNLLESSKSFFDRRVEQVYERFDESMFMRHARAVRNKSRAVWMKGGVACYRETEQFQHATNEMRRWLMAEPTTRRRYHDQRCEGYGNRYFDVEPGLVGVQHYDYRRVTDGMFMTQPNGKYSAVTHFEDLREGDKDLNFMEKVDILDSWDALKARILAGKDDPTSPSNKSL